MALNSEPLPARRAPIQWPRLSLAPGVIFNRISRRALVIAAVAGGIVPTWAIVDTSGTSSALFGWLALYTLSALVWLKDATTQWPTYLRRTGPLAALPDGASAAKPWRYARWRGPLPDYDRAISPTASE